MAKFKRKRVIKPENRRYYDHKKPTFPDAVKPVDYIPTVALDKFADVEECLGFGYIIVIWRNGKPYSIENQELHVDSFNKRSESHFVEIGSNDYYKDNERDIKMTGSYLHGFHYFRFEEQALYIKQVVFRNEACEIYPITVYTSNARGYMFGIETHVTTEMIIHKECIQIV